MAGPCSIRERLECLPPPSTVHAVEADPGAIRRPDTGVHISHSTFPLLARRMAIPEWVHEFVADELFTGRFTRQQWDTDERLATLRERVDPVGTLHNVVLQRL